MANQQNFPKAFKHGEIFELFENIYMVTGSVAIKAPHPKLGPFKISFSRNMVIVKEGYALTLINSVRLTDQGLSKLDELGNVKNVIRLAGLHGMDDPFYKDRYDAKIFSVNAPYVRGFEKPSSEADCYFVPDVLIDSNTQLPIRNAEFIEFSSSTPGESVLLLKQNDGVMIAGDCFQHWEHADEYFNFLAKITMKKMGFIRPYNIGPGWRQIAKPDLNEVKASLDYKFQNLIPSHGKPVLGEAYIKYRTTLDNIMKSQ